jgi:hypothetical protein
LGACELRCGKAADLRIEGLLFRDDIENIGHLAAPLTSFSAILASPGLFHHRIPGAFLAGLRVLGSAKQNSPG